MPSGTKRGHAISAPSKKPLFAWAGFLVALIGLGGGLFLLLPPEPLWRLDGGQRIDATLADRSLFVTWLDFTPGIVLRDLHTGQPIRTLFADIQHGCGLTYSGDGKWIARTKPETAELRMANLADGTERTISFRPGEYTISHYFSPDGSLVIVDRYTVTNEIERYRTVLIETATGKQIAETPGYIYDSVQFTPDGRLLLVRLSDGDKPCLKAWDVGKREWVFQLDGASSVGRREHFISPDGRTIIDKRQREGNEHGWDLWDLQNFQRALVGPKGAKLRQWSFSDDGRRVAIVHREKNLWRYHFDVWDMDTKRYLYQMDANHFGGEAVLSPDGKRLAVQTFALADTGDLKFLVVIDLETGRRLWQQRDLANPVNGEPAPAFGHDGRTVIIYRGGRDALRAEFHDPQTGAMIAYLPIAPIGGWTDYSATVSKDRRTHLVELQRTTVPTWWDEWLPKGLQRADENHTELGVIDVETQRIRARWPCREGDESTLLEGGRLLLTTVAEAADGMKPGHVCCWELPAHPAWRWVIGIPATLGGLVAAVVMVRRRRRAATA